jgi:TolB-like protein
MPSPSLLQRLKERKLVQWAVAYLAGAFVVFQLLDALEGPLGLSNAVQQGILAIVGIGFFITLILAWYHGEKGRQRVSGPELLMIALLLLIAGTGLSLLRRGEDESEGAETVVRAVEEGIKPAVAVLPFDNFSPNPDDAYFADGMHEEIIRQLSRISGIKVISRTSVMQYREARAPARQIAQELGVGFLLEGSARKAEDQVRLTVQLIDASSDEHVWADDYDRDLTAAHLFEIQGDVARRVATSLAAQLSPEERHRIGSQPTDNLAAYELYLLGRYHFATRYTMEGEAVDRAAEFYRRAIEADSGFALAYSGLADLCAPRRFFPRLEWASEDARRLEMQETDSLSAWAARRAVALDSTSAEAHTTQGIVLMYIEHNWEEAEREFLIAIEFNPGYSTTYNFYGDLLMFRRRWDEAVWAKQKALELAPLSTINQSNLAYALWGAGRLSEAAELVEALSPHVPYSAAGTIRNEETWIESPPSQYAEVQIYYEMGRSYDDALEALVGALVRTGTSQELAAAYERRWEGLDWDGLWASDLSLPPPLTCHWCQAIAYERLGRKREAVEALSTAYEMREVGLLWPFMNPYFKTLDDDPRYVELLREMGLRP